jgi:hypothetical protein
VICSVDNQAFIHDEAVIMSGSEVSGVGGNGPEPTDATAQNSPETGAQPKPAEPDGTPAAGVLGGLTRSARPPSDSAPTARPVAPPPPIGTPRTPAASDAAKNRSDISRISTQIGAINNLGTYLVMIRRIENLPNHGDSELDARPGLLSELADRKLEELPIKQRPKAFDAVFDATERLSPKIRAEPLTNLAFTVAHLPAYLHADIARKAFDKILSTARDAYARGELSAAEYGGVLEGLFHSLPMPDKYVTRGDGHDGGDAYLDEHDQFQREAVGSLFDELERLSPEHWALPMEMFGRRLDRLSTLSARETAFNRAWSMANEHGLDETVLAELADSARYAGLGYRQRGAEERPTGD